MTPSRFLWSLLQIVQLHHFLDAGHGHGSIALSHQPLTQLQDDSNDELFRQLDVDGGAAFHTHETRACSSG